MYIVQQNMKNDIPLVQGVWFKLSSRRHCPWRPERIDAPGSCDRHHPRACICCINQTLPYPDLTPAPIMKHISLASRLLRASPARTATRQFSTTRASQAKNRIFPAPVRSEDELQTLLLMSASTRTPLLTLWKTNWCSSCKIVAPLIRELVEKDGIGEDEGGVSFVEVEMDSPDLGGVGGIPLRYMINSIPTLLAFDRQEPQQETKVSRLDDLKNRAFLKKWIETEAARQGKGGAGGSLFGGFFGR